MNSAFAALGISDLIEEAPKPKAQAQKAPLSAKEQRALDAKKKEDKLRKKAAILAAGGTLPVKEKKEKTGKKPAAEEEEKARITKKAIEAAEREVTMSAEEKEQKLQTWRAERAAADAAEERELQKHVAHQLGIKATYLDEDQSEQK
tara:strand:+ start:1359 stop:1799 length:441 start_codon:yes stop_codon:yes gene_type:complete